MALMVVLTSWLSVGWECSCASAATAPVVAIASGMPCHAGSESPAMGAGCDMACCQSPTRSAASHGVAPQCQLSPQTCMAPVTSQTDIIAIDAHQPVVSLVAYAVPPPFLPEINAAVSLPAPACAIPLPLREPLSRSLGSRGPPSLV